MKLKITIRALTLITTSGLPERKWTWMLSFYFSRSMVIIFLPFLDNKACPPPNRPADSEGKKSILVYRQTLPLAPIQNSLSILTKSNFAYLHSGITESPQYELLRSCLLTTLEGNPLEEITKVRCHKLPLFLQDSQTYLLLEASSGNFCSFGKNRKRNCLFIIISKILS